MDYSRALFFTDIQSINSGSCVWRWPGLLRFIWPRSCLGSRWLVGVVVSDGSASCFYSLLFSVCKLCSLIVRTLTPLVYGFVPMRNYFLGEDGLCLPISSIDFITLIRLQDWACILHLRPLVCLLVHLSYLNISTLELLALFCSIPNYCCQVSCLSFSVSYAQAMKLMALFGLISNYCCPGSCLSFWSGWMLLQHIIFFGQFYRGYTGYLGK
uniref:Uncharacterized protein n=1 Tax=Opuntia streptacantha TaxID=393608 RepID=A0A7C8ZFS1_OPUST